MDYQFIVVRRSSQVTTITLSRPEVMNAIHPPMHAELQQALDAFAADAGQRVCVLTGAGERAFCAGSDLKFAATSESGIGAGKRAYLRSGYGGIAERFDLSKPVIAAVNGAALGGGFEIVLACDMVTAGKGARFGLPEVRRGLAARGGGVFRLPRRLPQAVAMELITTGAPLDAARAEHFGLVNRLVDDGQALNAALELAAQVAANAPMSVRASKAVAVESADWPLAEGFQRQRAHLEPVFASQDAAECVAAFRERRDPVWQDR
jgi:enoyl-CoA hydratase